jgi:hypothetical protein
MSRSSGRYFEVPERPVVVVYRMLATSEKLLEGAFARRQVLRDVESYGREALWSRKREPRFLLRHPFTGTVEVIDAALRGLSLASLAPESWLQQGRRLEVSVVFQAPETLLPPPRRLLRQHPLEYRLFWCGPAWSDPRYWVDGGRRVRTTSLCSRRDALHLRCA